MGNKNSSLREDTIQILRTCTGLTEGEIKFKNKEFLTVAPDGKLTRRQLKNILIEDEILPKDEKLSQHLFRLLDINGDGMVVYEEFEICMHVLASQDVQQKLEAIFRFYDINKDGVVSLEELKTVLNILQEMSTPPEGEKSQIQTMSVEELFKKMDIDKDNKISKEEFVKAGLDDELFVDWLSKLFPSITN